MPILLILALLFATPAAANPLDQNDNQGYDPTTLDTFARAAASHATYGPGPYDDPYVNPSPNPLGADHLGASPGPGLGE